MKRFLLCPVPDEQKPMNQYIELKETTFLSDIFQTSKKNLKVFRSIFFPFFFAINIQFLFFPSTVFQEFVSSIQTVFLIRLFIFFLIFLRWKDIYVSFCNSTIIYEEASWFDTQFWEKPFFLIKNDKLLATQKIRPQLQRLRKLVLNSFFQFLVSYFLVEILVSFWYNLT